MINLARTAAEAEGHDAGTAPGGPTRHRSGALSPEARQALRHAIARLAIDLVSGPAGLAAILRQGLLDKPYNTPSLPLDRLPTVVVSRTCLRLTLARVCT